MFQLVEGMVVVLYLVPDIFVLKVKNTGVMAFHTLLKLH